GRTRHRRPRPRAPGVGGAGRSPGPGARLDRRRPHRARVRAQRHHEEQGMTAALTRAGMAQAAVRLDPAAAMTVAGYQPDAWQVELIRSAATRRQTVVCTSRQSGKALAVDTPIPTPDGWTTMGALRAGDVVFNERGEPCSVLHAHDPVVRDCWRVTFSDRTHLDASGDHLWSVLGLRRRCAMRKQSPSGPLAGWATDEMRTGRWGRHLWHPEIVTTDDMRSRGITRGREREFAIPTTQ